MGKSAYFGYATDSFCILMIITPKVNNYYAKICSLIIVFFGCTYNDSAVLVNRYLITPIHFILRIDNTIPIVGGYHPLWNDSTNDPVLTDVKTNIQYCLHIYFAV